MACAWRRYAIKRDTEVKAAAEAAGITVASPVGHTLYDSAELIKLAGMKMPTTMQVMTIGCLL